MIWVYEAIYCVSCFFIGYFFLLTNSPKLPSLVKAGMAFPAGFSIFAIVTIAITATKLPFTVATILVVFTVLTILFLIIGRKNDKSFSRTDIAMPLLFSIAIIAICAFQDRFNMMVFSFDSFTYAALSGNISENVNGFENATLTSLITSYAALIPFGNSPAGLWKNDFLASSSLIFSLSCLTIVFGMVVHYAYKLKVEKWAALSLAFLAVLFVMSTPQFVFHTFYFMPNLPMSVYILAALASMYWVNTEEDKGMIWPIGLFLVSAGLCRLEGGLFVTIIALTFVLVDIKQIWLRTAMLMIVGMFLSFWLLFLSSLGSQPNSTAILSSNAALAQSLLLVAPAVASGLWTQIRLRTLIKIAILSMPMVFLFTAIGLAALDFSHAQDNLLHWTVNTTSGLGLWSVSWLGIAGASVLLALFGRRLDSSLFVLTAITSLLLVAIILGQVREFPYRLGAQDSGNRLMLQLFPVCVLFVSLWLGASLKREQLEKQ